MEKSRFKKAKRWVNSACINPHKKITGTKKKGMHRNIFTWDSTNPQRQLDTLWKTIITVLPWRLYMCGEQTLKKQQACLCLPLNLWHTAILWVKCWQCPSEQLSKLIENDVNCFKYMQQHSGKIFCKKRFYFETKNPQKNLLLRKRIRLD